jgi:superfamily I DNA and/or RNA helicase/very-short-patch-repair endonuclease
MFFTKGDNMDYRDKVEKIFLYLLSLKNINEKIIRSVYDYDKLYWEEDFLNLQGCAINKNSNSDFWIEVNKKSGKLYDDFFKLYQQNEKCGESFEIIYGYGLMCWKIDNQEIIHPVLETRMKIEFNALKRSFDLVPSGRTKFQSSIFENINKIDIKDIFDLEGKIANMDLDPRIKEEVKEVFENIIKSFNVKGQVKYGHFSKNKIKLNGFPVLYNTFVIFVRKNNMKLWQSEINNILTQIRNGCSIPEPIKLLVGESTVEDKNMDKDNWDKVSERVMFPLPANSEQKEIIKRISENYGVVMQGPPGTGKSHTIVNLICHLLTYGKRILVTSQTDRALRVLTEKIPEEIKPLCISLLGNDSESFKKLNDSVRKITSNLSSDPKSISKDIELLKHQLNSCIDKQKLLYRKLKELQDLEDQTINYSNKKYTLIDVAKWVKENSDEYAWIKDPISIKNSMPISNYDFELLKDLLVEVSREEKCKFDSIKNIIDKLPEDEKIYSTIIKYKKLKPKYKEYTDSIKDWYVPHNDRCNYDELLKAILDCKNNLAKFRNTMWEEVFKSYNENTIVRQEFKDLYYRSIDLMMVITKTSEKVRSHKIEIMEQDMDKFIKNFDIVYKTLEQKRKFRKWFKIIHPECGYVISKCSIDGRQLSNMDQAIIMKLFLKKTSALKELKVIWENTIKDYRKDTEDIEQMDIFSLQENIEKLKTIVKWNDIYKSKVLDRLGKIVLPETINWYRIDTYDYLENCVKNLKNIEEYNNLKAYLDNLQKLMELIRDDVGEYSKLEDMSEDNINKFASRLKQIRKRQSKVMKISEIIDKMGRVCPNTVKDIIHNWDKSKDMYKNIDKAWRWVQWNSILQKIKKLNPEKIEEDLETEKMREKLIMKDLVAKSTWYNQILGTTESQKRSLFSWMQAVKRIGKGRGKMVAKYRKIAQNEMEKCKDAIPVWIMPLNRVIENIKLSENKFDVIIFDESSQSDVFSLCALMRAKRAVIVGDDKQISPEVVGIDQKTVSNLIDKYLKDIPDNQWFDLQTSLYDTALRVFPNRLMLREHFRCVPEIIGFSNKLVYSDEIRPLRYPTLKETFYPPVKAVKVNGKRSPSKAVNKIEAEVVVDKIVECCKDPKYQGMSMGVISLLGDAQGNLIENLLRKKLGVEEIIKRRIVCGDAYSFQGDERDIMFLSMVISKDVKFAPLSRDTDVRRFNVASSRARNQMWLFHSVDLEDLSKECVRYSLLNYCMNYDKFIMHKDKVKPIFQSDFQKDVYSLIKGNGYNIEPQIKIGRYNIDFVIEGDRTRVAIICEGDNSREKYNFKEYVERQLDLERVGWVFLKIRGSEFYLNPEDVINRIFKQLNDLGIKPEGSVNSNSVDIDLKKLKVV